MKWKNQHARALCVFGNALREVLGLDPIYEDGTTVERRKRGAYRARMQREKKAAHASRVSGRAHHPAKVRGPW